MNGDRLLIRVREILRDVETVSHQGRFWDDVEIAIALNQSQEIFINTVLRLKLYHLLAGLHTTTGFQSPNPDVNDGWMTLPEGYLHYVSARVNKDMPVIARVYLGASADMYKNAVHAGVFIIKDLYRGIFAYNTETEVELNYYRRPSYIGLTSLGDDTRSDFTQVDFPDYVYDSIICGHAAVLLGMKETQTQREYKIKKHIFTHYNIFPKALIELFYDVEKLKELIEVLMGNQRRGGG